VPCAINSIHKYGRRILGYAYRPFREASGNHRCGSGEVEHDRGSAGNCTSRRSVSGGSGFESLGCGLLDEPRIGAPRKITDSQIEDVITKTLESMPTNLGRADSLREICNGLACCLGGSFTLALLRHGGPVRGVVQDRAGALSRAAGFGFS
jgi:hypothetical protein